MEESLLTESVKLAIQKAAASLARCEQCRASLEKKLIQKEFAEEDIAVALDYLEEKGYLSDERYASMWVRNHCAFKFHGKIRLLKELLFRGVKKSVAEKAINEFFETNDEAEFCKKACIKYKKQGKTLEKITKALADSGFSYNMIQRTFKDLREEEYAAE